MELVVAPAAAVAADTLCITNDSLSLAPLLSAPETRGEAWSSLTAAQASDP